jgi:hypothetical protein
MKNILLVLIIILGSLVGSAQKTVEVPLRDGIGRTRSISFMIDDLMAPFPKEYVSVDSFLNKHQSNINYYITAASNLMLSRYGSFYKPVASTGNKINYCKDKNRLEIAIMIGEKGLYGNLILYLGIVIFKDNQYVQLFPIIVSR